MIRHRENCEWYMLYAVNCPVFYDTFQLCPGEPVPDSPLQATWSQLLSSSYLSCSSLGVSHFCTGFPRLLESPGFFGKIFRTSKVLENDVGLRMPWKFKLKVLEFAGIRTQWCRRGCKNICMHTPLVFMICSYSDKTFLFATCDSDEHCSMDATVMLLYVE